MDFNNINIWAVLVAAVASFAIGFVWYHPGVFGKRWQKDVGLSDEAMTNANMGKIFGASFVLTFIMALVLASFHPHGYGQGIWMGGFLGIGLIATSFGVNYLFQRKSMVLWLIDAGYQLMVMLLIGLIIGAWR